MELPYQRITATRNHGITGVSILVLMELPYQRQGTAGIGTYQIVFQSLF